MNAQNVTSNKDIVEEVLNDYIDGYYNYVKPSEKYKDDVAIFVEKRIVMVVRCNQTSIQINLPIKVGRTYTDVLDEFLDEVKVSLDRLNYVAMSNWEIEDLNISKREIEHVNTLSSVNVNNGFKVYCVDYFYILNTNMQHLHKLKTYASEASMLIKMDNAILCTDDSFLDHYEKADQLLILEGYCLTTNNSDLNVEESLAVLSYIDLRKYTTPDNYDVALVEKKSFTNGRVWYIGYMDISNNAVYKHEYYYTDFPRVDSVIKLNNDKAITI